MIVFEEEDDAERAPLPRWLATFADLMCLIACFFVLLLSFSKMEVNKFKQIAGSMAFAFGVQRDVVFEDIPLGTSIIAQEFSPGKTTQTPVDAVRQVARATLEQSLRIGENSLQSSAAVEELQRRVAALLAETEADANKLRQMLADEVQTGKVDVESEGRVIVVRIRELGSFPLGSATLNPGFIPVMGRMREALGDVPGTLSIEGHTDNLPVRGGRYTSNWDLSSSRALSVTHELLRDGDLDDERIMVVGFADTHPVTSNDSAEGRASNRRVEIVIRQGLDDAEESDLEALRNINPEALKLLGID